VRGLARRGPARPWPGAGCHHDGPGGGTHRRLVAPAPLQPAPGVPSTHAHGGRGKPWPRDRSRPS
jgi:hypothetical protein